MITEETIKGHWRFIRWRATFVARKYQLNADDLFQDVMERIWMHRENFEDDENAFRAWVMAITSNRAIDMYRRDTARSYRKHEGITPMVINEIGLTNCPEKQLEARDEVWLFFQFVRERYGKFWEDIFSKQCDGISIRNEVAKDLQINHGSIFRKMKQIRDEFQLAYR